MMVWRRFPADVGVVCEDEVPDSVKSSTNIILCDQLKCLCVEKSGGETGLGSKKEKTTKGG